MALCDECNRSGALHCAQCKEGNYCSKECQRKAWKLHKPLCQTYKEFQDKPNEGANEKFSRAIYFDPHEEEPRFVWLKWTLKDGYDDEVYWSEEMTEHLALTKQEAGTGKFVARDIFRIFSDQYLDRKLDFLVLLAYRDGFLIDGSTPNKAIASIADQTSKYLHDWRGPIIAYGAYLDNFFNPDDPVDLDPTHIAQVAKALNWYKFRGEYPELQRAIASHEATKAAQPKSVQAVRLNYIGDIKVDKRPFCEQITIPANHAVFRQHPTPISARIEMPVAVLRVPGNAESWHARRKEYSGSYLPYVNQPATFLHLGCDPKTKDNSFINGYTWGWAPLAWQNDVGSVIVARTDKKPLLPEHVEALGEYCQGHLQPFFESNLELQYYNPEDENGDDEDSEDEDRDWKGLTAAERDKKVLNEITKTRFEKYFSDWKEKQEDRKRSAPSPYTM